MLKELPDGSLVNALAIETVKPGSPNWRVTYQSGRTDNLSDEAVAVIREAVAAPTKNTRKTK